MRFDLEQCHRHVPDDELLTDVHAVAGRLGIATVTIDKYNEHGKFHATTLTRRFGKWFKVLERAGLQKSRSMLNIPEDDLFRNLEELWTKLGRQPRYSEVVKPHSKFSAGTYENRFGGYRKALEKFVLFVNSEEAELLPRQEAINARQKKSGRNVNWRLRFVVMRRDNFKCRACGRSPALDANVTLDVDHILAWSKGGATVIENLQTLCRTCNIGKSDLDYLEQGFDAGASEAQP